jgi:hypothetical protein
MLKGVHLTLMIGPAVPLPVPSVVLDALQSVEVTSRATGQSGFQLVFSLSNKSPLQTLFLLSAGASPLPIVRVVIIATLGGTPNVLMDGVMTNHSIAPGSDSTHSTLTVIGSDLSEVMRYLDFTGLPYPAMPAEARVALILAKYAVFGVVPLVIPSVLLDVPIPTERIPIQKQTDLDYINQLAETVGYVFYVDPGPAPGTSVAYWGPQIKVGVPQPALNINMDAYTNVETLSFNYDSSKRKLPSVYIQEPVTKMPIPIPIPDITPLNPPLGLIPPPIVGVDPPIEGTAKYSPVQAMAIGLAKAAQAAEAVSGEGSLDVLRYGRLLKARGLVGVRGAGMAFDGLYYVNSVTHQIKRGEYKQSFKLSRNGLISTFPRVPA